MTTLPVALPPTDKKRPEIDFSEVMPHDGQLGIIEAVAQNRVVCHSPGRRWGKSALRPYVIIDQLSRHEGFVEGICGAQAHAEAENAFDSDLFNFGKAGLVAENGKAFQNKDQRRYIDFVPIDRIDADGNVLCSNNGGRIWYPSLSADSHQKFQGHGAHFAVLDECSHFPYEAWNETIEPMLAVEQGHALLIGTPIPEGEGFAWWSDEWQKGAPDNPNRQPGYVSTTGPSYENPWVDKAWVEQRIADMTANGRGPLAQCLYMGRFVAEMGAVFQNIDAVVCLPAREVEPGLWINRESRPGELVVISIDFGRHDDATIAWAFSHSTMEALGLLRIERTEYPIQLPIIDRFVRRYEKRTIWAEGREEAASDLLRMMYGTGLNLIKWTSGGTFDKATCVAKGMDLFERKAWKLIDARWGDQGVRYEFEKYAREKTPSGRWTYNAPKGSHDDTVSAALYATYALPLTASAAPPPNRLVVPDWPAWKFVPPNAEESKPGRNPFILRRRAV